MEQSSPENTKNKTPQIDFQTERKIEVNHWIIKSRWLYMVGILLIGVLTKTISQSNLHFPFVEMVSIVVAFTGFNLSFYLIHKKIEKQKLSGGPVNAKLLAFLGYSQLFVELITFTFVMHKAGGVESISAVFFFLPIVSASLLFGLAGSITVAAAAGILVNLLVVGEYFNAIPHIPRYSENTLDFLSLPIALTKTITTSIFYVIIGIFSGFGAKLLFQREAQLKEQAQKLDEESRLRKLELEQLDQTSKLLIARDRELSEKNAELDEKINESEGSKNSLLKALNKIEEEKNKTLAIISNFTDPIIVLDNQNRITLFNMASKIILGLQDADLGTEVSMKDDFSLENFKKVIRKNFKFKKIKTDKDNNLLTEELCLGEGETESTYKVITVNIRDNSGNYTGVMKIFYDFTREKIIDKMKSDFISIAAHQLRTPLSAIKWSTGMILGGDAGPINIEQENLLRKSYVSNEAMINLVNDLLNVSRIEEGRFGYNFKNVSVAEIFNTVVETSKPQIEKNVVDVNVNIEDKDVHICADKEKMVLVFQNLLENSLKYTPRHGKITITAKRSGDSQLAITLKDTGVGIPKNELEKLFTKFFRASNVVLMETEGTGLGLFIVKNIIEKHGGTISILSEEGKGTETIIKLPAECKL